MYLYFVSYRLYSYMKRLHLKFDVTCIYMLISYYDPLELLAVCVHPLFLIADVSSLRGEVVEAAVCCVGLCHLLP